METQAFKGGDLVSVCPTYRGFNGQAPKTNGVIVEGKYTYPKEALVEFAGWGGGHRDTREDIEGHDLWYIPTEYLKLVIQPPEETPKAEPLAVSLYPSDLIILKHLKARKSISAMEALVTHGCPRLAPRIFNLRAAGHDIETSYHRDQMGHRYSRYTLKGAA